MAGIPGPLSPEAIAAGETYYSGGYTPAPTASTYASDPASYYGAAPVAQAPLGPPPPPPAPPPNLPPGIDPSWLRGAPVPPAVGLNSMPAAETVKPGQPLFGGPSGAPTMPKQAPLAPEMPPPAAPANMAAGGPTAGDDREFAALMALQRAKKPAGGGGGGAPANPDPFGIDGANRALLDSYRMQGEGILAQSDAERARSMRRAEMLSTAAKHREEDATIQLSEQAEADRRFNEMQADAQKQLDEVRAQKVDPDRLMKSDGMAFKAIIGGLFGGLYMGINKLSSNPFIDNLNKQIDRDIAAQEKNIDQGRAAVADKMNLIRDQRTQFKDSQVAKLQAKNLAYEATITAIEAEAAKFDDPISQARAAQGIAGVQREQAAVQKQLGEEKRRVAMAASAAGMADVKAKRELFKEIYEKGIASGMAPAQAESEATRMLANLYGGGAGARPAEAVGPNGDPLANVPKNQHEAASKELQARADVSKATGSLEQAWANFDEAGVIAGGRDAWQASIMGMLKPHMKGANSDADLKMLISPLVPVTGEPNSQRQAKLMAAKALLQSGAATPVLDRYAPSTGPKAPQQYGFDGKPLKR